MLENITLDDIIIDLCEVFRIKITDFMSKKRDPVFVTYRQIFYYITTYFDRKKIRPTDVSNAVNRDHSLIIRQRRSIIGFMEIKDDRLMLALKVYQLKSSIYKKVEDYYKSIGKTMNYEEAFETAHSGGNVK